MKRMVNSRRSGMRQNSVLLLISLAAWALGPTVASSDQTDVRSIIEGSRFVTDIPLKKATDTNWLEFQIPPDMFDGGRWDLSDLRLIDANDNVVPYAIRVRKPTSKREPIRASLFNRGTTPEGAAEVSLDLGESGQEHNEVEVRTAGSEFRRKALLEGSDDGQSWNKLTEKNLLRFQRSIGTLDDGRFAYSASRFRYLRVRVWQDPDVDSQPVDISEVVVRHSVEVKGELVTREAQLGPRESGRQEGVSGSWWPVDLGGTQVPIQWLEVEIEGEQFARNYLVTPLYESAYPTANWTDGYRPGVVFPIPAISDGAAGPNLRDAFSAFSSARGEWRRKPNDPPIPLVAGLGDVRAGKLRLFIEDSANEPLNVKSVKYVAPACVVVIENRPELVGPLRACFGHALAEPPNYDFARNLPATLDPPPARLEPGTRADNPDYIPPPLPFTERFPLLIHGALGLVCLLLAALVIQLARRVLARHDARAPVADAFSVGG